MLKELLADMVDQIKDTAGSIIEYPPIEYQRGIGIDTQARKPHMCWFSAESLLERTTAAAGVLHQCSRGGGSLGCLLFVLSADVRAVLMTSSHSEGQAALGVFGAALH